MAINIIKNVDDLFLRNVLNKHICIDNEYMFNFKVHKRARLRFSYIKLFIIYVTGYIFSQSLNSYVNN